MMNNRHHYNLNFIDHTTQMYRIEQNGAADFVASGTEGVAKSKRLFANAISNLLGKMRLRSLVNTRPAQVEA